MHQIPYLDGEGRNNPSHATPPLGLQGLVLPYQPKNRSCASDIKDANKPFLVLGFVIPSGMPIPQAKPVVDSRKILLVYLLAEVKKFDPLRKRIKFLDFSN